MFSAIRRSALASLSLLWGGSLLGSYAVCSPASEGGSRIPKAMALLSSATLVAAAWLIRSSRRTGPAADYSHQIAKGMTWGFVGDVCMTFSVPLGMATFGLGHIEYIRGMLRLLKAEGGRVGMGQVAAWLTWLGVGVGAWFLVVRSGPKGDHPLAFAALPYTLLLASTAGVASGLLLHKGRYAPLALGSALFLASDLVIALRLFQPALFAEIPASVRGDLVWLMYGPGQALIVSSALCASEEGESP